MSKHTPGPWVFHENGDGSFSILDISKKKWIIGFIQNGEMLPDQQVANAERIVACVNACKGITNEELSKYFGQQGRTYNVVINDMRTAQAERDTLLKAIQDIIASSDEHPYIQNIAKRAVEGLEK